MGRARVGVPPGERRLRAAHVERVGAAAVGAGGGVIAGKRGGGSCARWVCSRYFSTAEALNPWSEGFGVSWRM